MAKITRERFKTFGAVFDNFTSQTLQRLITQGHFEGIIGPLSIGKESNVFIGKHAEWPRLVKIYRLETCDFNQMFTYIRSDPRYSYLKGQRRKVIFSWTQREYRNLTKARMAGLRVPTPFAFRNNVLVEEFIGTMEGDRPAASPMLKDKTPEDLKAFYKEIVRQMKLLAEAGLVHGDLSSFNILNHKEKPVIIDMSQTTVYDCPRYLEFLERDCKNVTNYFIKQGLEVDRDKLYKQLSKVRPEKFKNDALPEI